jgi:demethylmenaquinone methyltransferase/2-methoxy-6-polyprenyl-1,4-benzoquinol methylase
MMGYGPGDFEWYTIMSEQRSTAAQDMETSYGFRSVGAGEKQSLVNEVFHKVANRYDLMNDLMSGGLHRFWKDGLVAWLNPPKRAGWRVLDVAGGTGDVAFRIIEASHGQAHATVLDINGSMLAVGRERAEKKGLSANTDFVEANAEELPFADDTFDAYTIAFGIRNVPRIETALAEAFRVLKPGGRFLCLEFSEVDMPLLDRAYEAWSFNAIPRLGQIVTGEGEPYSYLVESIRKFPNQTTFAAMLERAGFGRVKYRNYSGGIAALHSGWKL